GGAEVPSIPLWIAGGGEKKTLRIAARFAQHTNFDGSPEGFSHKSSVLEQHCRDVGRDFGEITRSADYNVVIGENQAEVDDKLAWSSSHYRRYAGEHGEDTINTWRTGPLVGTTEQVVEALTDLKARGMTYAIVNFANAVGDRDQIEL